MAELLDLNVNGSVTVGYSDSFATEEFKLLEVDESVLKELLNDGYETSLSSCKVMFGNLEHFWAILPLCLDGRIFLSNKRDLFIMIFTCQ